MTHEQIEQAAEKYALTEMKFTEEQAKNLKYKLIVDVTVTDFIAGAEFRQAEIDELKNQLRIKNDELRMLNN